jgi:dTDP-4-dehydrorhamnose reductase
MSNILITGANGLLGSSLCRLFDKSNVFCYGKNELDITNRKQLLDIFKEVRPDVVIHAAANTDVEKCEIDAESAYQTNVMGTQNLVDSSILNNALFVYISSTGVYGDYKHVGGYSEFDNVKPCTVHHATKLNGEKVVSSHLSKFLIIRTGWLYGGNNSYNDYVKARYDDALNSSQIYSDNSQIGNPTNIDDLSKQIMYLIDNGFHGTFNCVNEAFGVSRFDYTKLIIESYGLPCKVISAKKKVFNRVAPVSDNESAINYKLNLLNINVMRPWDVALKDYIASLKKIQ